MERVSYDPNGNILTYLRNGFVGNTPSSPSNPAPLAMDNLTYNYNKDANGNLQNNKLNYVADAVGNSNYTIDIDNQSLGNYEYDEIGNLTKDVKEGIAEIKWNVYGKISSIHKTNNTIITYKYDASGNRIAKIVTPQSGTATETWYVRDASGNVMSVYESFAGTNGIDFNQAEISLYGSSRIGIFKINRNSTNSSNLKNNYFAGKTLFELSNHLGNVLVTVTDKKLPVDYGTYEMICRGTVDPVTGIENITCSNQLQNNTPDGIIDYFMPEVVTAQDYYPFGMTMPGRTYNAGSVYRYGFNGKENDNEVYGEGNFQDYGMRVYDPRIGRLNWSVDPLTKDYPELTPYQYGSNNPIWNIDLDGLEGVPYTDPKQMLYQAGADITQALGRAWDKVTGFFGSWGNSDETELTKTKSIVVTNEKSIDVGGNMESWIRAGRYSSNNTMPKLKLSNFYDIQYKDETKIELKTKVEAGNVKVENKINLSDGSTEVKGTVKIPANQVTKVPLKVSGSVANNNTTNTTKAKLEVKTDTKPIAVGGSIEVQKDNNGNVNGKAAVSASYEKKVGKVTHTSTLTVGKKF